MENLFELLTDKRFSLKFRILNILSNDYLRNYLAVGVMVPIINCEQVLNISEFSDEYKITMIKFQIAKIRKTMNDVWHL